MTTTITREKPASTDVRVGGSKVIALTATVAAVFGALLILWHSFDHALPQPDDSSFILSSFKYASLLHHPKFWALAWWHSMLTVDQAYPPAAMIFNGVLHLVCGTGDWVNVLSIVAFNTILTFSISGIAYILTKNVRAAIFSAIIINLYPQTTWMSHGFALDAPLMAMISAALCALVWWRSAPSWPRAIACGAVLGCAVLTKQIAAAYLIVPGLFCLGEALVLDFPRKNALATSASAPERRGDAMHRPWRFRTLQLLCTAAVGACVSLPWWLTNLAFIRQWASANASNMGQLSLVQVFPEHITWYMHSLPCILSPLLLACLVASAFIAHKELHNLLAPVALSALGGVVIISMLTWAFPSLRYGAPAMIATAVFTGCTFAAMWENRVSAISILGIFALAGLQYLSFNFAPFPLSQPDWLVNFSEALGVRLVETIGLTDRDHREMNVTHSSPAPFKDWGERWALETVTRYDGNKHLFLNVLPEVDSLNVNTLNLLAAQSGSNVHPTTSRHWTVMGDRINFSPEEAMYYQWYLVKSGYQGNIFRDDESKRNYESLVDFVENGDKFKLIATRKVIDASTVSLYRQR